MSLAVFVVTLVLIIVMGVWIQSELDVRRKKRKKIRNKSITLLLRKNKEVG